MPCFDQQNRPATSYFNNDKNGHSRKVERELRRLKKITATQLGDPDSKGNRLYTDERAAQISAKQEMFCRIGVHPIVRTRISWNDELSATMGIDIVKVMDKFNEPAVSETRSRGSWL